MCSSCIHARTRICMHVLVYMLYVLCSCCHGYSKVVEEGSCYEWPSYIRGYHDYQAIWISSVGEMLILKVEPTNRFDDFVMSVVKDGTVVGHVPKYASRVVSYFLKKVGSVGFCEVSGGSVNQGVGLGLGIPCRYKFYGCQAYLD